MAQQWLIQRALYVPGLRGGDSGDLRGGFGTSKMVDGWCGSRRGIVSGQDSPTRYLVCLCPVSIPNSTFRLLSLSLLCLTRGVFLQAGQSRIRQIEIEQILGEGRNTSMVFLTDMSLLTSASVPVLDDPFQPRCGHPTRRLPVPLHTRNGPFPSPNLMVHLTSLIIPKAHPTSAISTGDPVATGANIYIDCVPACIMATELLFTVLAEAVSSSIHDNLVIATLEADRFSRRMRGCGCEGEHVRFSDELDGDGNVQFPCPQRLVVGGSDEAAVFVDEGDGIDWAEVMVIFLSHFAGAGIVLNYLLIRHAG